MQATSDLSVFLSSTRNQIKQREEINVTSQAATMGIAPGVTKHLSGDTLALSLLERKTDLLEQQRSSLNEAAIFFGAAQSSLGRILSELETVKSALAPASQLTQPEQVSLLAQNTANTFVDVVETLNSKIANKYIYSGAQTDSPPLPDGQILLSQVEAAVSGLSDINDIEIAVNDWLDDPAGPFLTTVYQGSGSQNVLFPLSQNQAARFDLRADSAQIRQVLKTLALGALAKSDTVSLAPEDRRDLLSRTHALVSEDVSGVVTAQGLLGLTEERIGQLQTQNAEDSTAANLKYTSLVGVDQFEEVTRLESAQQQLELMYRIAARRSEVTLSAYLR